MRAARVSHGASSQACASELLGVDQAKSLTVSSSLVPKTGRSTASQFPADRKCEVQTARRGGYVSRVISLCLIQVPTLS